MSYALSEYAAYAMPAGSDWSLIKVVAGSSAAGAMRNSSARLIGKWASAPVWADRVLQTRGRQAGFTRLPRAELWRSLEDELPALDYAPAPSTLSVELEAILTGSIHIKIQLGATCHQIEIDDAIDGISLLMRFIAALKAERCPHADFSTIRTAFVSCHGIEVSSKLGLFVNSHDANDNLVTCYATCDRIDLLEQFRNLAIAIAQHPLLLSQFIGFLTIADDQYDHMEHAFEAEFIDTRGPDYDPDECRKHVAHRMALQLQFGPDVIERYQRLRFELLAAERPVEA